MTSRILIGDVFAVPQDENVVGFFQYIARDSSQLNSHVVRVFKERERENDGQDVNHIVQGEVDFHAHVFLSAGVKLKAWRKLSRVNVMGGIDVVFRNSSDYGKSKEVLSNNWFVWRINGPHVSVGALGGMYRDAEIGVVVPARALVYRMNNGVYDFYYPEPE